MSPDTSTASCVRWRRMSSQLRDPAAVDERVRARLAEQGALVGVAAAEPFRVIRIER